jgi:hypothetical protein
VLAFFTPQWISVVTGSNEYNSWIPISSYPGSTTITTPAIVICTNAAFVSFFIHLCCDAYQHLIDYELAWVHTVDLLKLFVRVSITFKFFGV